MLHNEARSLMLQAWEKTHNASEVAECFSVDPSTVYRLIAQMKKTGDYHTRTNLRGRKAALSPEQKAQIAELVDQHNDITLLEIIEQLHLSVSDETVRRALRVMGYTFKKKTLNAAERNRPRCASETEIVERRYCWSFRR